MTGLQELSWCQRYYQVFLQQSIYYSYVVTLVHLLPLYCHDCPFFACILSWLYVCCLYIITHGPFARIAHLLQFSAVRRTILRRLISCISVTLSMIIFPCLDTVYHKCSYQTTEFCIFLRHDFLQYSDEAIFPGSTFFLDIVSMYLFS